MKVYSFLLVGAGVEKNKLIEQANKIKVSNLRFIDPVPKEEAMKYILASDIGTSVLLKRDTFKTIYSNKTFDYMACKKPILLAIDGVSRELIETAKCGLFVEPENSKDFVNKVRVYLKNKEKMIEDGLNGYNYVEKNFDRHKLALNYLQLLKNQKK